MQRLVLASGNPGKLKEFRELLVGLPFELVSQRELGIEDPEETGASFVENALLKARNAARLSGLPALADDSGLMVDALGGQPGLYSARYAGLPSDGERNWRKLLAALAALPASAPRTACFVCIAVFVRAADDVLPRIAEGIWSGEILAEPRGHGGFGYDPVFRDPLTGLSASELEPADKNARSHRGLAFAQLRKQLEAHAYR